MKIMKTNYRKDNVHLERKPTIADESLARYDVYYLWIFRNVPHDAFAAHFPVFFTLPLSPTFPATVRVPRPEYSVHMLFIVLFPLINMADTPGDFLVGEVFSTFRSTLS